MNEGCREVCMVWGRTLSKLVESCPLTMLNGGLSQLHSAGEDAVSWLTNYGSWHAYEKKKKELFSWHSTTIPGWVTRLKLVPSIRRSTLGNQWLLLVPGTTCHLVSDPQCPQDSALRRVLRINQITTAVPHCLTSCCNIFFVQCPCNVNVKSGQVKSSSLQWTSDNRTSFTEVKNYAQLIMHRIKNELNKLNK